MRVTLGWRESKRGRETSPQAGHRARPIKTNSMLFYVPLLATNGA
jgi:hypothetical protein